MKAFLLDLTSSLFDGPLGIAVFMIALPVLAGVAMLRGENSSLHLTKDQK